MEIQLYLTQRDHFKAKYDDAYFNGNTVVFNPLNPPYQGDSNGNISVLLK